MWLSARLPCLGNSPCLLGENLVQGALGLRDETDLDSPYTSQYQSKEITKLSKPLFSYLSNGTNNSHLLEVL